MSERPQHDCLASALAAAQAEFGPVVKDKTAKVRSKKTTQDGRPIEYTYQYADLSDVIDAVTPALSKHGLAQVQRFRISGSHQTLVTELRFKAEVLDSEIILPIANSDPQEVGKVITYFRRYALQALLGITAERDDDAADTRHVKQPAARQEPRAVDRLPGVPPPAHPHDPETGEVRPVRRPPPERDTTPTYPLDEQHLKAEVWVDAAGKAAKRREGDDLRRWWDGLKPVRARLYRERPDLQALMTALKADVEGRIPAAEASA